MIFKRATTSTVVALFLCAVPVACDEAPPPDAPANTPECTRLSLACANKCDERGSVTQVTIAGAKSKEEPASEALFDEVPVNITVLTAWSPRIPEYDEFLEWVDNVLDDTNMHFRQCGIGVRLTKAELRTVAPEQLELVANHPDSWSGVAPPVVTDTQGFNYVQHDRLPGHVRTFFEDTRTDLADGGISIIFLDRIEFHAAQRAGVAGGLSFPPVLYHHKDDFPARNTVVVGSGYRRCGSLPTPPASGIVAHELTHMLLNLATHSPNPKNLLSRVTGNELTGDQCKTMRENAAVLYGRGPFVDPGMPPPAHFQPSHAPKTANVATEVGSE